MKNIQKILAVLIAMTMAMVLALPAFAEDATQDISGHTFAFYKVFSGTPTTESEVTTWADLAWADGVSNGFYAANSGLAILVKENPGTAVTPAEVASWLNTDPVNPGDDGTDDQKQYYKEYGTQAQRAAAFAKLAAGFAATAVSGTGNSVTLTETGYYLVVDTTGNTDLGNTVRAPAALLQATEANKTYTIKSKTTLPTVEKKIWEESLDSRKSDSGAASKTITDFAGVQEDEDVPDFLGADQWNDVGDYDVGDDVPFKLTATIPAGTMNDYNEYHIVFKDTLGANFGTPTNFKVYATLHAGTAELVANQYKVTVNAAGTVPTFTVDVQLLGERNGLESLFDGAASCAHDEIKVYVVYTAQLKGTAAAATGQENDVVLDYSNDYNGEGEGETPKDTVVAMTFDFDVNKYDSADNTKKLAASFKLYKVTGTAPGSLATSKQTDGSYDLTAKTGLTEMKFTQDGTTYTAGGTNAIFTTVATDKIVLHGLDTGNYILVETSAPAGYNVLTEGVPVTIATTGYTRDNYIKDSYTEAKVYTVTAAGTAATDHVVQIANSKGATLPSTGGMGTTLFTIIGLVLMGGAGVLLVAKRRTNK